MHWKIDADQFQLQAANRHNIIINSNLGEFRQTYWCHWLTGNNITNCYDKFTQTNHAQWIHNVRLLIAQFSQPVCLQKAVLSTRLRGVLWFPRTLVSGYQHESSHVCRSGTERSRSTAAWVHSSHEYVCVSSPSANHLSSSMEQNNKH